MNIAAHRIAPGSAVDLDAISTDATPMLSGPEQQERAAAEKLLADNTTAMQDLQYRLWAEHKRALLVVLQGMDTSGKDGTIRHVFGPLNPQGVRIRPFKAPTQDERNRDFLWRVHAVVPSRGYIGVFNRSHYEDVGIVRVRSLVPESVWRPRYEQINAFEDLLTTGGTTIIKIFLHISKAEQKQRLQARLDDPTKRWKFEMGDLEERKLWGKYTEAYSEAIARTSTEIAPWFVVPVDQKWYRNYAISAIVRDALERMDPKIPETDLDPKSVRID